MKTYLLLILLMCGAFLSCNAPQQDKATQTTDSKTNIMTNEQLREKLAFAFSGATSDEDLVVAKHGIERMKGYLGE